MRDDALGCVCMDRGCLTRTRNKGRVCMCERREKRSMAREMERWRERGSSRVGVGEYGSPTTRGASHSKLQR